MVKDGDTMGLTGLLTQIYNPDMYSLFLTDYPITRAKMEEILSLVKRGENVTSLWMPHSGRTDFAIRLQEKKDLEVEEFKDVEFLMVDFSLAREYLERNLEELKPKITELVNAGKQVTLVIDNFVLNDADWVKYVFSLRHGLPLGKLTFLILAFESDFYAYQTQKNDVGLIYHNIIKVPYFTRTDAISWLGDRYPERKDEIVDFCGGIVGLLINYVRSIDRPGQIHHSVEYMWGRFSERERHVLKSIATTGKVPPYTFELKYMKEHRLITDDNKIIGTWINQVVNSFAETTIVKKGDELAWDGVNINELFTDTENEVFNRLLEDRELSRDTVAEIVWGKQAIDKYSDWAIDQMFSRLRKKLDNVGIGGDKIVTLKGRGFRVQNLTIQT